MSESYGRYFQTFRHIKPLKSLKTHEKNLFTYPLWYRLLIVVSFNVNLVEIEKIEKI